MAQVARTRSRELFTLAILALALAVATSSAWLFGVSLALGAFLAGMVVGQTEVSHQAAADALPMKDAFAVLFFVSVGMLFDPSVLMVQPLLLLGILAVVMLAKPLAALVIVWSLGYSPRTALIVAVALAQIGEFSFLLADEAMGYGLLPSEGQSLLVACALISITLNPLLFRWIPGIERWLRSWKRLWELLSARSERQGAILNEDARTELSQVDDESSETSAVVIGYGPVGHTASVILRKCGIRTVIVDLNLDVIRALRAAGELAIYGDASRREILESAGIRSADYLLVTVPDVLSRTVIIMGAKDLNPRLRVFTRARYLQERAWLEEIGATEVCTEEAETAFGLAVLLLREMGASEERIQTELTRIEQDLGLRRMTQESS
jgi:CPA2 family monovalent cation:H+ antiporter-2